MKRIIRNAFVLIWIAALVLLTVGLTAADVTRAAHDAAVPATKRVFVLNSFNRGYTWTDNMLRGIDDAFGKSGVSVETYVAFMDMKRIPPTPQYFLQLKELIREGYEDIRFDAILACDNDALEFMRKYRDELFPGVPVVFSSINNFDAQMLDGRNDITGTSENTDYAGTIQVALKLRPAAKNVVVVVDGTTTGNAHRSAVEKIRPNFPPSITFTYLSLADLTQDELAQKLSQLRGDSVVLLLQHFVDKNETSYTVQESTSLLTQSAAVPVFVVADIRMDLGALGGHVVSGYYHGDAAAQMVVKILNGAAVKSIPVLLDSPNKYMFDYSVMQRFNIAESDLPPGSILINKPVLLLDEYKPQLLAILGAFITLCGILIYLLFEIRRRQKTEAALRVSEEKITRLANEQRLILNGMSIGVSFLKERKVQYSNPAFDQMFGYAIGATQGMDTSALYPNHASYEQIGIQAYETIASDRIYTIESVMKKQDGSLFDCSLVGQAIDPTKPQEGSIWMLQDITERIRAEQSLQRSESLLRLVADNLPAYVAYVSAPDLRYQFVNRKYEVSFQRPREQIIGQHVSQVLSQANYEFAKPYIDRAVNGEACSYENSFLFGEEQRWIQVNFVPDVNETGEVNGVVILNHDITERKQTEQALRESENKYRQLVETTTDWVWSIDLAGCHTYSNSAIYPLLGYQVSEIMGTSFFPLVHPADEQAVQDMLKRCLEQKVGWQNVAIRWLHKDGSVREFESTARPVVNADGQIVGFSGMDRDITERKRAEVTLRESELKYRSLIENSSDVVFCVNAKGEYQFTNHVFASTFGKTPDYFVGKTFWDVYPKEDADYRQAANVRMFETGVTQSVEVDVPLPDKTLCFIAKANPIKDETGKVILNLTTATDITERKRAEEALRESAERHQTILQTAMDGFWLVDLQGRLLQVNATYCRMSGYSETELLAMRVSDLELLETRDVTAAHIQKVMTQGEDRFETRHRRKNGSIFDVEISVQYQSSEGGRLVAFLRDITERKQTEQALNELQVKIGSQELYSVLVEMASDGFWLLDKQFMTVYVNPAIEGMLGYTKAEMIGRSWYDFGDPEWVARAKELEKRRESGIAEPHQFLFIHKDGRKVLARIATTPLYDSDGNFNGALGILSDITRQKEAEEALKIKNMLNALAQSAGIGMCILNPDYTIVWYNDLHAQWYGALEKTRGRNCFEVFEGRDAICPECPARASFEQGVVATFERTGRTTSAGADRIHALTTSPIRDAHGNVIEVVKITQDITERKRAEEEIQKLNAELEQRVVKRTAQLQAANGELEAFSYSISHDLRAPLRGIDGWSHALLEDYGGQLDGQAQTYLHRVRSETQRMSQLIDDLLQFSRLTRAEMRQEQVNLSVIAQTLAARLQENEPQRIVEFAIQPGLFAQGDSHLLEVALTNLLGNAFKFTGKVPQARIEFGQTQIQGQRAFFVRDNGAGFDMAYAQKLFGAFQRMHKASEFPGTGIGLATVQRIIHRHGGRVWAKARVNQGTTFYFTLEEIPGFSKKPGI